MLTTDHQPLTLSSTDVCSALSRTNARKAAGPDGIPGPVLRACAASAAGPVVVPLYGWTSVVWGVYTVYMPHAPTIIMLLQELMDRKTIFSLRSSKTSNFNSNFLNMFIVVIDKYKTSSEYEMLCCYYHLNISKYILNTVSPLSTQTPHCQLNGNAWQVLP